MRRWFVQADITPESFENRTFTTKLRGYDPDEVNEFVAEVAAMLRDHKKHADRAYQAVGEEMGEMLQQARDRADSMIASAESKAADTIATANTAAEETRRAAEEAAAAARAGAEEDAARLRADAERAAAETRRTAEEDATRLRTDAANAAEETRSNAQRDAEDRTARADERVRLLESRENEARDRIRALQGELHRISELLGGLEPDDVTEGSPTEGAAEDTGILLETAPEETAGRAP
ncbi:MAG TPA: DivIVA domain-containing protein [Actinomycetota bacterium]|nr:DivIVA domain-containing protein [Actinomycetota bacterium]